MVYDFSGLIYRAMGLSIPSDSPVMIGINSLTGV